MDSGWGWSRGRGFGGSQSHQWGSNTHLPRPLESGDGLEISPMSKQSGRGKYKGRGITYAHQQTFGRGKRGHNSNPRHEYVSQTYGRGKFIQDSSYSCGVKGRNILSAPQGKAKNRGRGFWKPPADKLGKMSNMEDKHKESMDNTNTATVTQPEGCSKESVVSNPSDVDTGVDIWAKSTVSESIEEGNDGKESLQRSAKVQFDSTVDWDAESYTEEYVIKPKTYTPMTFNSSNSSAAKTNPDATDRWIAKTLEQKPVLPNTANMEEVFSKLETLWRDNSKKDKTCISQFLSSQFNKSVNPYALVLFLMRSSGDVHVAKTVTLAYFVMKEFEKFWKQNHSRLTTGRFVDKDMQLEAFHLCTRKHLTMFDMALRCFELCYPGNTHFLPTVKNFVRNKKFKEVGIVILFLLLSPVVDC